MIIKVLGSGCPSCQLLKHNAEETIKQLELHDVEIDYITDVNEIVDYGVMSSPAFVIGDDIKTAGRIASIDEIKGWLQFGEKGMYMSIVSAIVALFQAPILMLYLHFTPHIKHWFS